MTLRFLVAGVGASLIAACASPPLTGAARTGAAESTCREWFAHLDDAVRRAAVADAQETRVENHPHLRANRFVAALAQDARIDDSAFVRDALPQMRALDRAARSVEFRNLPQAAFAELGASREQAWIRTERCAGEFLDTARPDRSAIRVPDDYSDALRLLGAYALTRYPFTDGVRRELAEVKAAFAKPRAAPAHGKVRRYAGAGHAEPDDAATRRELTLLERHQPVFEVETTVDDDLPGALAWDPDLGTPVVRRDQPAVYRQIGFTRYRGRTLTQLVYTIWFGARPAVQPGDLRAGHLDGLIWRVTLDAGGEALIYDTIHPCGCYHYFFPTSRATPIPEPADEPEWAFVPASLRAARADERIVLRVATRTHSLERVTLEPDSAATRGALPMRTLAQDRLRALPVLTPGTRDTAISATNAEGTTHSAYAPDGLVPGTERPERFLFWPMGIVSAGQMRQWGRHATAFVGRRHFDDADLFEKRFVFDLNETAAAAPAHAGLERETPREPGTAP